MTDYFRLFYYHLLLRSYIGDDNSAILAKWAYLPTERKFIAVVSTTARWQDGTQISARDAAYSLAKALTSKQIGKYVKVVGTKTINDPGWMHRDYEGIKIISTGEGREEKFELTLASELKNVPGVLVEVLGPGSKYNRIWPARLDKLDDNGYKPGEWDLCSNYPVVSRNGRFYVKALRQEIALLTGNETPPRGCDFQIGRVAGSLDDYTRDVAPSPYCSFAVFNPDTVPKRADRMLMARFLRAAFAAVNADKKVINSFFSAKQMGHSKIKWDQTFPQSLPKLKGGVLSIMFHQPQAMDSPLVAPLHQAAARYGVTLNVIDKKDYRKKLQNVHALIWLNYLKNERHSWLQDVLTDDWRTSVIRKYRRTYEHVVWAASNSIPFIDVQSQPLIQLEKTFYKDASIIPIDRYYLQIFSRKSAPIHMKFNIFGDLFYEKRRRL